MATSNTVEVLLRLVDKLTPDVKRTIRGVKDVRRNVNQLNKASSGGIRKDFQATYRAANRVTGAIRGVKGQARSLNRQRFGRLNRSFRRLEGRIRLTQRRLRSMNKEAAQAGTGLRTLLAGAGVAFAAFAGVRAVAQFEFQMNRVQALTGATQAQFEELKQTASEFGRTTQFSASQAAEALGFLAQAGGDAVLINKQLGPSLQLAAAAGTDLGRAADIVTNIMAGYRLEAEDLNRVNDVLVKTFTSANTDLVELSEAMKLAAPVAAAAGLEFEETAAVMGLLGNAGLKASIAGTSLRGAITRLLNPSSQAAEAMERLGINAIDASGGLRPLNEIIQQMEPNADRVGDVMTVFGQRAGPAMLALVGQGSQAVRDLTDTLRNSGGTAERIAKTQMKGLRGEFLKLKSAAEGLALAIGEAGLLSLLTNLTHVVTGFVQAVASLPAPVLQAIGLLGGLAAAVLSLGIMRRLSGVILVQFGKALGNVATAIGFVRTAMIGLVSIFGVGGAAVAAAAGVVFTIIAAYHALKEETDEVTEAQGELNKAMDASDEKVKKAADRVLTNLKNLKEERKQLLAIKEAREESGASVEDITERLKVNSEEIDRNENALRKLVSATKGYSEENTLFTNALFGVNENLRGTQEELDQIQKELPGAKDKVKELRQELEELIKKRNFLVNAEDVSIGGDSEGQIKDFREIQRIQRKIREETGEFASPTTEGLDEINKGITRTDQQIQMLAGAIETGEERAKDLQKQFTETAQASEDVFDTAGFDELIERSNAYADTLRDINDTRFGRVRDSLKEVQEATVDALKAGGASATEIVSTIQDFSNRRVEVIRREFALREQIAQSNAEANKAIIAKKIQDEEERVDKVVEIEKGLVEQRIEINKDLRGQIKNIRDDALNTWQHYKREVVEIEQEIRDTRRQFAFDNADAERQALNDVAARQHAVAEIRQNDLKIEKALRNENIEAAKEFARRNLQLSRQINQEVKDEAGNVVVSEQQALAQSQEARLRAQGQIVRALGLEKRQAKEAADQQKKFLDSLDKSLKGIDETLGKLNKQGLNFEVDIDEERIKKKLKELSEQENVAEIIFKPNLKEIEEALRKLRDDGLTASFDVDSGSGGGGGTAEIRWTQVADKMSKAVNEFEQVAIHEEFAGAARSLGQFKEKVEESTAILDNLIGSRSAGGFSSGGAVSGPGTSTSDSIMARLSTGEFVMRAAAVKRYGAEFMSMLNSGRFPDRFLSSMGMPNLPYTRGFATGGLVEGGSSVATSEQVIRIEMGGKSAVGRFTRDQADNMADILKSFSQ